MPLIGSLAKVGVVTQPAPFPGRTAGQPACAQSRVIQSQVCASEHVHELQACAAKSPGVHDDSPTAPARPVEPASPDEPAGPVESATPPEPAASMVPAAPAVPASFIAPTVALLPAHASATQLDTAPNPSHRSFAARFMPLRPFLCRTTFLYLKAAMRGSHQIRRKVFRAFRSLEIEMSFARGSGDACRRGHQAARPV